MFDPDTDMGGRLGRFPSTQTSLLEAARGTVPNEALERVIAVYWKPVYRFLRAKFGKNNEDAKDLTQGFFASALERELFARFDPAKASFRTYLRMAVERFAANQHAADKRQKRGGDVTVEPLDDQALPTESPEQVFEREWRRQVLTLAVEDLRAHCARSDRQLAFRIFEAYDLADRDRPSYADLAKVHGVPETTVTNQLAWARRTLRALVADRLRGVTAGEHELRREMRRLWN